MNNDLNNSKFDEFKNYTPKIEMYKQGNKEKSYVYRN